MTNQYQQDDANPSADRAEENNACFSSMQSLLTRAIQANGGDYKSATVDVYSVAEALLNDYGDGDVKEWLRSLRDSVISTVR